MNSSSDSVDQENDAWTNLIAASHALYRSIEDMRTRQPNSNNQNREGVHIPTANLNRFKEAFCCHICVELYDTPYTLECGHTFCAVCMNSWFQRQKTCPQCRQVIVRRPTPAFAVQDQVKAFRKHILGQEMENDRQQQGEQRLEDRLKEMFPITHRENYVHDTEDGVYRCGVCMYELEEDGLCERCNINYRINYGTQMVDAMRGLGTETEEEESNEDDESLEGFVVFDENISEASSDESLSSTENAMYTSSGEESFNFRTSRNRPPIIYSSASDESETEPKIESGNVNEGPTESGSSDDYSLSDDDDIGNASMATSSSEESMHDRVLASMYDTDSSDNDQSKSSSISIVSSATSRQDDDTDTDDSSVAQVVQPTSQSEESSSESSSSNSSSSSSDQDTSDSDDDSDTASSNDGSLRKRRRTVYQ